MEMIFFLIDSGSFSGYMYTNSIALGVSPKLARLMILFFLVARLLRWKK
jgi:hypothetical protein